MIRPGPLRLTGVPQLLILALGLGTGSPNQASLAAQSLRAPTPVAGTMWGGPMMEPEHWTLALLELLDAGGSAGAWMGSVGLPHAGEVHGALLMDESTTVGAPGRPPPGFIPAWRLSLQEEFPVRRAARRTTISTGTLRRSPNAPTATSVALRLQGGYRSSEVLPLHRVSGWMGGGGAEVMLGGATRAWAEWVGGAGHPGATLHRAGLAVELGSVTLSAVRHPLRLGPGQDDPLLSGLVPLDAVHLRTSSPLQAGWLGRLALSTSLARLPVAGNVESPWHGTLAVSVEPFHWLRVGGSRTAVFGGEDRPPVTGARLWGLFTGRHSDDTGEFEDQHAALFLELRPTVAGFSFRLHGLMAANDTEGGIRDDPAALAGVTLPLFHSSGLWGFRYEYAAFGARARLCTRCDEGRSRSWYNHYVYGPHSSGGVPLGSSLGGYGASHRMSAEWWAPGGGVHLRLGGIQERREVGNLLSQRWFGTWNGAEAKALLFPEGGARISFQGRGMWGPSGANRWGGEGAVHLTFGLRR
ncbi:MAG: capsule assembly Wzi family protein [Gemmatimonadota bacterium]